MQILLSILSWFARQRCSGMEWKLERGVNIWASMEKNEKKKKEKKTRGRRTIVGQADYLSLLRFDRYVDIPVPTLGYGQPELWAAAAQYSDGQSRVARYGGRRFELFEPSRTSHSDIRNVLRFFFGEHLQFGALDHRRCQHLSCRWYGWPVGRSSASTATTLAYGKQRTLRTEGIRRQTSHACSWVGERCTLEERGKNYYFSLFLLSIYLLRWLSIVVCRWLDDEKINFVVAGTQTRWVAWEILEYRRVVVTERKVRSTIFIRYLVAGVAVTRVLHHCWIYRNFHR